MNRVIGERTKGNLYPISIGTSVALECFFGLSSDKPSKLGATAPYLNYQCILANVRTMARNYLGSYKAQELPFLLTADLYAGFVNELILINNIVADQSAGKVVVSFYNNTYYKLKTHLKKVNIKQKYTTKQEFVMDLENKLCELLHANSEAVMKMIAYEYTNEYIRQGKQRNVIITHYPMDLLLTTLKPDLLESHTGKIKKPYHFPSKLKRAGDDVPFNKYTLQILGDSSGYILSASSSMRNELLKICKDKGVSPVTQEKRFIKTIKESASSELKALLSGM